MGLSSLSLVVAVVEGAAVMGVITVIVVVDDVGYNKQPPAFMKIIFWNELTYNRLRSPTIQSPELPIHYMATSKCTGYKRNTIVNRRKQPLNAW